MTPIFLLIDQFLYRFWLTDKKYICWKLTKLFFHHRSSQKRVLDDFKFSTVIIPFWLDFTSVFLSLVERLSFFSKSKWTRRRLHWPNLVTKRAWWPPNFYSAQPQGGGRIRLFLFRFSRCRKSALLRRWLVANRHSWDTDWSQVGTLETLIGRRSAILRRLLFRARCIAITCSCEVTSLFSAN